jgi:hypothetical protein
MRLRGLDGPATPVRAVDGVLILAVSVDGKRREWMRLRGFEGPATPVRVVEGVLIGEGWSETVADGAINDDSAELSPEPSNEEDGAEPSPEPRIAEGEEFPGPNSEPKSEEPRAD